MKNPTVKELDRAIVLRLKGENWKNVLGTTGLSHSQAERHEFRFKMWLFACGDRTVGDWSAIPATPEAIVAARQSGTSWGVIGERAGIPEARVRKLFAEATNVKSLGLRIGKGGRFAYGDENLYVPDPKGGVAIPTSLHEKPELDEEGRIIGLNPEQVKALKALGVAKYEARKAARAKKG